jgi:hypothetical protein
VELCHGRLHVVPHMRGHSAATIAAAAWLAPTSSRSATAKPASQPAAAVAATAQPGGAAVRNVHVERVRAARLRHQCAV